MSANTLVHARFDDYKERWAKKSFLQNNGRSSKRLAQYMAPLYQQIGADVSISDQHWMWVEQALDCIEFELSMITFARLTISSYVLAVANPHTA